MPILVQIGPLVRPVREPKESKKKEKSEERNFSWRRFPINFDQWLIITACTTVQAVMI